MTYGTLLSATGYVHIINRITIIAILINIGLNLILIPSLGAIGASWTTVIALSFLGIFNLGYVHFKLEVKVPWDIIIKLLIIGLVLMLLMYSSTLLDIPWWVVGICSGVLYSVICVATGLLPKEQIPFGKNKQ